MRRVYIETYGCQMNVSDSELMFGVLGGAGYVRTADPAEADVLLVNTCAVRDHAEQRVLGRMGELKRYKRPGDVLGVVGCMAQRLGPKLLERVPQVDLVIGPDGYRGLPELIAQARGGERAADVEFKGWEHYADVDAVRGNPISAFVTVQSGSSRTLKRMLRRYDRDRYLEVVAALRAAVPGISLSTDIIVGFPGETEEEFQETLSLVEQVRFDDAYTFKYSVREGTPAVRIKDHVGEAIKTERIGRLIALVRGVAKQKNVGLIGTTHEVLVEGQAKRGALLQARTRTNKVALLDGSPEWIGTYRRVRFTGTTGSTFTAVTAVPPLHTVERGTGGEAWQ